MLELSSGKLPATPVPLGGGAVIRLRPATGFEVDRAAAAAQAAIRGLVLGEDAASHVAAALGDEFKPTETSNEWRFAAAQRLALIELVLLCNDGWDGVALGGDLVPMPTRETVALLLRDPRISAAIEGAVNARVHKESAEKNGSAALPNGEAAAAEPTAPNANPSEVHAPKDGAAPTEISA